MTDITVPLMKSVNYVLPSILDPDYGANTSVLIVKDNGTNATMNFITFNKTNIIINPTVMPQVKAYTIIVIITDTKDTKLYSFNLNVTN